MHGRGCGLGQRRRGKRLRGRCGHGRRRRRGRSGTRRGRGRRASRRRGARRAPASRTPRRPCTPANRTHSYTDTHAHNQARAHTVPYPRLGSHARAEPGARKHSEQPAHNPAQPRVPGPVGSLPLPPSLSLPPSIPPAPARPPTHLPNYLPTAAAEPRCLCGCGRFPSALASPCPRAESSALAPPCPPVSPPPSPSPVPRPPAPAAFRPPRCGTACARDMRVQLYCNSVKGTLRLASRASDSYCQPSATLHSYR